MLYAYPITEFGATCSEPQATRSLIPVRFVSALVSPPSQLNPRPSIRVSIYWIGLDRSRTRILSDVRPLLLKACKRNVLSPLKLDRALVARKSLCAHPFIDSSIIDDRFCFRSKRIHPLTSCPINEKRLTVCLLHFNTGRCRLTVR